MNKKKIAFLCFSALPYTENWGGSQRVHYMANSLSQLYDVTVIGPKDTEEPHFTDKDIYYHTLFFKNDFSRKIHSIQPVPQLGNNCRKPSLKDKLKSKLINIGISVCKKVDYVIYNEPVYFMGILASVWIKKNGASILEYLKRNQIELLIISVPPWNMINIAFLERVKTLGSKLILDYRDPWNCWNDHTGWPLRKERRALHLADFVFVTNANHAERLKSDFRLAEDKVGVIMNGYDESLWKSIDEDYKRTDEDLLIISFIGTISFNGRDSFRNPATFMQALSTFEYKDRIKFRVVGCYSEQAINQYRKEIPNFEMIPNVPQKKSLEWMMRSDVLINFHTTNDRSCEYLIAGKIFDYYRSGKSIISINGKRSYERAFVEENKLGYFSENNIESIKSMLSKMYLDWINNGRNFSRKLNDGDIYSREYQNNLACDYINKNIRG